MIHRMLRFPAGWEWHVVQQSRLQPLEQQPLPSRKLSGKPDNAGTIKRKNQMTALMDETALEEQSAELKRQFPECAAWVDESSNRHTNHITVNDIPGVGPLLSGTLMVQISEDQSDVKPVHFWLTRMRLVTMHEDMRVPLRLQSSTHMLKFDECQMAPEAFFIMIGVLLETFHAGLDGFERRLGELERTMRRRNRTGLLDVIFDIRYDLLHWSHLFIPIRELHGAAQESFANELAEKDAFIRMTHRLDRIESLLKHYALEIDTLISMDDAISSFRRNDIMKTLTIFTVLFLTATIAGSLIDWLPFRSHPRGFTVMAAGIAVITIGIYLWLWKKSRTGDLLNKRGRIIRLSAGQEEQEGRTGRYGKRKKRTKDAAPRLSAGSLPDEQFSRRSRRNRM